ncbi:DUF4142 domain-containing protein [Silvimonas sp. JCM 19000]
MSSLQTRRVLPALLAGLLLAAGSSFAADTQSSTGNTAAKPAADVQPSRLSADDADFVDKAGHAGAAEIQSSRLALKHSKAKDIKAFANMMIEDHTKAAQNLETVAALKAKPVPHDPDSAQQAEIAKLEQLHDKAFDQAYVQFQVKAHEEAVALFQKEASGGSDADVKGFAAKTEPTLQGHLDHAKKLATKYKVSGS